MQRISLLSAFKRTVCDLCVQIDLFSISAAVPAS